MPSVLKHDFTTRGNEKYTLIKIEKINNDTTRQREELVCNSRYFFGKGKPIKAYFVTNEIEHIYDVKQEYWDTNKKKRLVKEVPIMPSLILFRTTRTEAEEMERKFLNKVMLYRGKNSENLKEPSKIFRTRSENLQYCGNFWC